MKLIVGLGNPGKQYAKNRHNIGFMVLDAIVAKVGANCHPPQPAGKWKQRVGAIVFELRVGDDQPLLLAAPQQLMNNSGKVVVDLIKYYNLEPKDLLVICDDLNLDFGTIRIRKSGGHGGHNGLESLITRIGLVFDRVRIGIRNKTIKSAEDWHDFVLANFTAQENQKLPLVLDLTVNFVLNYLGQNQIKKQTLKIAEEAF